ncbi:unnamed protein product [Malus baccata var. baccata]
MHFLFYLKHAINKGGPIGCVWYADGTERNGTGRDGAERDGTGRNEGVIFEKDMGYICLKMVKHCVPQTWNKPVPGGRGGTQKHPKSVPWNDPFHPFLAHQTRDGTPRSVPFRPVPRLSVTSLHQVWREKICYAYTFFLILSEFLAIFITSRSEENKLITKTCNTRFELFFLFQVNKNVIKL